MRSAKVFIVDYDKNLHRIKLRLRKADSRSLPDYTSPPENVLEVDTNGIDVHYFVQEITEWHNFRRFLIGFLCARDLSLVLRIIPPEKEPLDYIGNEITSRTIWEKVEIENMMSWLSTLGGGFSALGDSFVNCAEIARKISLKQLALGIRIGDPFIQVRCKLFYSISLIQTGKLRLARHIIESQYKFAVKYAEYDARLVKMCQGIWLKLQYEHKKGRHRRKLKYNNKLAR
ncbi:unnamed protein product [Hermetia illucens]|uniref:Uncharacterized protein n=1 Tax=Hermetia illucens TaxID=343691 RepID=A0A7R8UVA5_HERIL|nr:uncharacterized protein F58A4.6 [Hermetia illucens]CAD7087612.1 unnamed protein product [Hermetia illucens]